MKVVFAIAVVAILLWIGWNVQQNESRAEQVQHERARQAKAYLDCMSHAKDTDLCIPPSD